MEIKHTRNDFGIVNINYGKRTMDTRAVTSKNEERKKLKEKSLWSKVDFWRQQGREENTTTRKMI